MPRENTAQTVTNAETVTEKLWDAPLILTSATVPH